MKKLIIMFLLLCASVTYGQNTLETNYSNGGVQNTIYFTDYDSLETELSKEFDASLFNGQSNVGIGVNYVSASANDTSLVIIQGKIVLSGSVEWVDIDTLNTDGVGVRATTTSSWKWTTFTPTLGVPDAWRIKMVANLNGGAQANRSNSTVKISFLPVTLDVIPSRYGLGNY